MNTLVVDVALTVPLAILLTAVAWIDLKSLRIPDSLSLPLIITGLLKSSVLSSDPAFLDALIGATVGFALFAAIGEFWFRRTQTEALGLGDAKLFSAAGAWLGWTMLPPVLLIASLGGIAMAVILRKRGEVPFGPALAAGFLVVWIYRL